MVNRSSTHSRVLVQLPLIEELATGQVSKRLFSGPSEALKLLHLSIHQLFPQASLNETFVLIMDHIPPS